MSQYAVIVVLWNMLESQWLYSCTKFSVIFIMGTLALYILSRDFF